VVGSSGRILLNLERKYAILSNNGNWAYYVSGGPGTDWVLQETTTQISANRWVHIALVLTATNTHFYVDGNLVHSRGSRLNSGTATTVAYAAIGGWANNTIESQRFDGQVDEIKIWQEDRSANIVSDMHSKQAPAAGSGVYWDFNEGSGTRIYDRVGAIDLTATTAVFTDVKQVTTVSGGDTVVTFPRTYLPGVGGWRVPDSATNFRSLVVAGGGSGGSYVGGGGGGGGVLARSFSPIAGSTRSVEVGQGAAGVGSMTTYNERRVGLNGQNSRAFGFEAIGGGGGGLHADVAGRSGGSGGGGGSFNVATGVGGAGEPGQGFAGGERQ
jgi:hypothetical protein